jgi:CelD/BcsL family acetyltransferase involved in cellulose biosynthesis
MNSPSVRLVSAAALTLPERERWTELQEADHALTSPFFSPEFTSCVAAVHQDTFVAVLEVGDRQVGFFPFQRSGRTGFPVGGRFSDYQGVILEPGVDLNPIALVRACNLREWVFDHVLASQGDFEPFHRSLSRSPYLDLSHGFEAYVVERQRGGSRIIADLGRKARKLDREIGPLRFVTMTDDPRVLRQVLRWKSDQYLRKGLIDLFASSANLELVERVHDARGPRFVGMLSALYAGDRLIAGHMGMRSRIAWHWWLPSYDTEVAPYSPGAILLLRMAEAAPGLGVTRLDLGRGEEAYKLRFMSGAVGLAEGFVPTTRLVRVRRDVEWVGRAWVRNAVREGVLRPDAHLGSALRTFRRGIRARLPV